MADADAPQPPKEELADLYSRGFEPATGDDWLMMIIAALDVLLLVANNIYGELLPPILADSIIIIDLAVIGLFAIEFVSRMLKASSKLAYARNHWYDLVGMVPIADVSLRSVRFVRLARLYAVSHFPPEHGPGGSWMTALVRGVIVHYRSLLVEEISDPIVLASINIIEGPLTKARFAATLGSSLDERRGDLEQVVAEAIRRTRGVGSIMEAKLAQRIVHNVTDAVLDSTIQTLRSDELNDVISGSIQDILNEVRAKVEVKEYKQTGGSFFRPRARLPPSPPDADGPST